MLVGLKESVATQAARQAGLRPDVTYGRPDDRNVPEGVVYSQSIREGSIAEDGDTVTLWVSTRSS
jgi:beta-lactam-binding protein with PASTA domain